MSRHERTGKRDLTYSAWHRTLGDELTYIDVDACEYCAVCRRPLLLIEVARDVGQRNKPASVLQALANLAGLPAIVALYSVSNDVLTGFRVQRVAPAFSSEWVSMTPHQYAKGLTWYRRRHDCAGAPAWQTKAA